MCNRMTQAKVDELHRMAAARYGVIDEELAIAPSYNTAPQDPLPVVRADGGRFRGAVMQWGPVLARVGRVTVARAESLLTKRMFEEAARRRRCLILADGFLEFQAIGRARIPHRFILRDGSPFVLAGLYELPSPGQPQGACLVVTTEPNALVGRIHTRMPILLSEELSKAWAEPEPLTADLLAACSRPFPSELMDGYRVNASAANSHYKEPDAIEPWAPPAGELPLGL